MRLSAGRQRTVTARPHTDSPVRERIPGSMKLNRPMASATFAAAIPRNRSTSASGSRAGAVPIRKPNFGPTDEDDGGGGGAEQKPDLRPEGGGGGGGGGGGMAGGGGGGGGAGGGGGGRHGSIDDGESRQSMEGSGRQPRGYLVKPTGLTVGEAVVLIRA